MSIFLRRDVNEMFFTQVFVEDQFYTQYNPKVLNRVNFTADPDE